MRNAPPLNPPPTHGGEARLEEYDDEYNFAHMGARHVGPEWGMPKPPKRKQVPT